MKKKTAILIILICLTLCFTACSKEAKFYEYTGPMPFENSMDVEFGMTVEEVEGIVSGLENDNTTGQDYYAVSCGSLKEGGIYEEKYRFDGDGKLDYKDVSIFFICDDKNGEITPDEEVFHEKYKENMTALHEYMNNELSLSVEIPQTAEDLHSCGGEKEDMAFFCYNEFHDGADNIRTPDGCRIWAEIFIAVEAK